MLALVLSLVLTQDAGVAPVKFDAPLYASCPDAPASEPRDGGVFLPDPRPARLACIMATCEMDRQLKDQQLQSPPPSWVQVAGAIAVTVGAAINAIAALTK